MRSQFFSSGAWACVFALFALAQNCFATIDDGEPWDWGRMESSVNRSVAANSVCDAVAQDINSPKLKCVYDKDTWNKFLASEIKKPYGQRRKNNFPSSCMDDVLHFFRWNGSNGHMPSPKGEAKPMIDELGSKIAVIKCTFKDTTDSPYFDYDPKAKTLIVYQTLKDFGLISDMLQTPKMRKFFPVTNKYWDDGHPI